MKRTKNNISRTGRWLISILVFCLVLTPALLQARELDAGEVRAAVQTWVRHVTADAQPEAVIERMEAHQVDGETVGYIAHLMGGGFCLCGADDLVLPIYLYCPQGTYDPQNPDYQYFLWEIETRLKYLRAGLRKGDPEVLRYREALAKRTNFWEDLIAGCVPPRGENKVEPMQMEVDLTCTWDQGSPYNDRCPQLTPGADEHCVVGCVATATSQLMYYWKWPNKGQSDGHVHYNYRWRNTWDEEPLATNPNIGADPDWVGRLEWAAAGGGKLRMNGYWDESLYIKAWNIRDDASYQNALQTLCNHLTPASTYSYANFGATTYNWSLMEDDHTDPPDAGDDEVAELCYHAGIAVDMTYGVKGSLANSANVESALQDHFRYDIDATYGSRNINTMTGEIQWLRPLHLRGTRHDTLGGGGHAWVVLGYNKWTDPDRQFKMNMGWGGAAAWYTCDNVPGPFNIDQQHTTRIAPQGVVRFVGDSNPGDGTPNDPYEDIEEAIVEAPDYATLIFKAGSDNTYSGASLVINRPFTLKGKNAVIRRGPFAGSE